MSDGITEMYLRKGRKDGDKRDKMERKIARVIDDLKWRIAEDIVEELLDE